jgi:hypothetical protein
MFLIYGGKCLSRKVVNNWMAKVSLMTKRLKRRWEVAETTVKILLCCGFRCIGKTMGQVYQFWRRIHREMNVFPRFEYHMFYVLYTFVSYLLTLQLLTHYKASQSNILNC